MFFIVTRLGPRAFEFGVVQCNTLVNVLHSTVNGTTVCYFSIVPPLSSWFQHPQKETGLAKKKRHENKEGRCISLPEHVRGFNTQSGISQQAEPQTKSNSAQSQVSLNLSISLEPLPRSARGALFTFRSVPVRVMLASSLRV